MNYAYILSQLPVSDDRCFLDYESIVTHFGSVDPDGYVYADAGIVEADTPAEACEKLFEIYNINHPADYEGRSMSVSDIVKLSSDESPFCRDLWFCDSIGFKKLNDTPAASPEPVRHKYNVTFTIDGRYSVDVLAADREEAKAIAECYFEAADFGPLEIVESKVSLVTGYPGT